MSISITQAKDWYADVGIDRIGRYIPIAFWVAKQFEIPGTSGMTGVEFFGVAVNEFDHLQNVEAMTGFRKYIHEERLE